MSAQGDDLLRLNGESLVLFTDTDPTDFNTAVRLAKEDGWRVSMGGEKGATFFERVALVLSEVERRLHANPYLRPYEGDDRVVFYMTLPSVPRVRAELAPAMRLTRVTGIAILATPFDSRREGDGWLQEGIPVFRKGTLQKLPV